MTEQPDYPLEDWQSSELLKEAAIHLRDQSEYVQMNPAAKIEMTRFCHAVRRELMVVQKSPGLIRPRTLYGLRLKFGLPIETDDFLRYKVHVHGYVFTFLLDIPLAQCD